jgi:hypothetical protein
MLYSSAGFLKTLSVLGRQIVGRKWIAKWKRSVDRDLGVLPVCSAWRGHALNRAEMTAAAAEDDEQEEEDDDHVASVVEK